MGEAETANIQTNQPTHEKPLRVWPGVVIIIIMFALKYIAPMIKPEWMIIGVFGGLIGAALIILWWLFFSRARWLDRIGGILLMAGTMFLTSKIVDKSISEGAMGMLFPILSIPFLCLAFVASAVLTRRLSLGVRRVTMVIAIFVACGVWTLLRTGGFSSDFKNDFAWRWSETPEDRLLAQSSDERVSGSADASAFEAGADWPGFRGPNRDGIIRNVKIKTDWTKSPPKELWRRPIGPGWSSFAVSGNFLYTQEQRGGEEIVACYKVDTGEPVWKHRDSARFWESNAGAGPRSTPTLHNDRVYALGGTGIVNALDARNGARIWSRNAAADTRTKTPIWGFSGSPLVINDALIVGASGALVAYDLNTGNPKWFGPPGKESYSSPHRLTINGVDQILMMSGDGAASVSQADGKLLWKHEWKGYPIVQPAITTEGDVLVSVDNSSGTRRISVTKASTGWTAKERWTSINLKPYFNDFVVHNGYAYGIDGRFIACIDLKDGTRKWKGGRFGGGQLVLLAEQELLLVLSEKGELALVKAAPDKFTELAQFPAIKGKTWNHPVLVRDVLLVRNAQEMAAFRLALER